MASLWTPLPVPLCAAAIEAIGQSMAFYVNGHGEICYLTAPTEKGSANLLRSYTIEPVKIQTSNPDTGEIEDLPVVASGPQVSAVAWETAEAVTEIRVYYVGIDDPSVPSYKLRELKASSTDSKTLGAWTPGRLNQKNDSCDQLTVITANVNYWGTDNAGDVKVFYQRPHRKGPSLAYADVNTGDWSQGDLSTNWT